ncbi:NAD(P)/FAD-dependent oxidoreductase [Flavisphingomonas formosensis]|uniref:NAD(P)/FAD-dependent oxidoreductase n=1 Tax=Flavisphingomonas formosensis TaxID=861534 RepID=UPI0012F7995F|nr:FAD-binding oxidoreductase [Sphingomonas formosensis]
MTRSSAFDPAFPSSWYAATRNEDVVLPPLEGSHEAEVAIVGGGYTGVSAALHLARAGRQVVLLEAARIGWGASGRNGGQVHVGMRREQEWLEAKLGPDAARQLWAIGLDAREHLDWAIREYGIACDLTPGLLHVDHKQRYVPHTRRTVDHLREAYGYEHVRFVERDELGAMLGGGNYHGGMLDMRGGHLHALNWALGLARAARQEGALLAEESSVTAIEHIGDGWRLRTDRGEVRAGRVIVAANGYLRGLVPEIEARVMPINNFVAVTQPLGRERAESLIRGGYAVSDSRFVVYYFRITPDQRLLFGGGENYSYSFPGDIAGFVRRHMLGIYPGLADVGIDYAWGGTLAVTPHRLPYVRELRPGLYGIGGFSGLGVLLAPYFGKLVADAITGGSPAFDALTRLPVPSFPGGRLLRWPTLVAAMSFYALRDRL